MRTFKYKYAVSFNNEIGNYSCGDNSDTTLDYVGDNKGELIREVLEDEPQASMIFKEISDDTEVEGLFLNIEDGEEFIVAILYLQQYFTGDVNEVS
jgi:hypothetical protein